MRYVMARYAETQRELAYRIYVTDALKAAAENTAKIGGGSYIKDRWADSVGVSRKTGSRSAMEGASHEEVVSHILGKLREVRENGCI